ncbi:MAG: carbohydrate kinase family protein [Anaerolineae bacterium]|nr:carbohydrate kinase family protein [Anaerolineae bacterium]
MKDFDILVVGELNLDLIITGDVTPAFGQAEKLVDDATFTLGSSSAIFAGGVARLGLRVAFIGKVGDDDFGQVALRFLQERGIDTSGVVIDPTLKTGLSVILSRPEDRAILTHLGAIAALRYEEIDQTLLARARHLHLGSFFLLDSLIPNVPTLFETARSSGLTTSLDTNYDPLEQWNSGLANVLAHTNVFLPNEIELRGVTGETNLAVALGRLARRDLLVATKLGPEGAIAQHGNKIVRADPLPVDVVDTTGAGDSFDAGFIYGYLAGWELSRALRLGCVCGSLSTRATGGATAQATLDEALAAM